MAFDDRLFRPFVFLPDGSPEAQVPPPHGHIRLPARFIPHGSTEPEADDTDGGLIEAEGVDDAIRGETPWGRLPA